MFYSFDTNEYRSLLLTELIINFAEPFYYVSYLAYAKHISYIIVFKN